jgi:hypothetical protein
MARGRVESQVGENASFRSGIPDASLIAGEYA